MLCTQRVGHPHARKSSCASVESASHVPSTGTTREGTVVWVVNALFQFVGNRPLFKRVFDLVMRNRTSQSLFRTRSSTTCLCPGRPGHWHYATTSQARCRCVASSRDDWTPCSDAYFASPLAQGTPGKQCGLRAAGDSRPSCSRSMAGSDRDGTQLLCDRFRFPSGCDRKTPAH